MLWLLQHRPPVRGAFRGQDSVVPPMHPPGRKTPVTFLGHQESFLIPHVLPLLLLPGATRSHWGYCFGVSGHAHIPGPMSPTDQEPLSHRLQLGGSRNSEAHTE